MAPRFRRAWMMAVAAAVLALVPVTAVAVAAPGDGDATYGAKGFAAHRAPQGRDGAIAIESMADGRVVVLGYRDHGTYVVTRLLPSGALDQSFGGDGHAELTLGGGAATPSVDHTALLVGPDAAVTVVAVATKLHPAFALATGRLTAAGLPDTAWAPGGVRTEDLPGALLRGPAAHRLVGGEIIATLLSYQSSLWYHHTIRVAPSLAVTTREISTDDQAGPPAPTLIDDAGRWVDVSNGTYDEGGASHTELVITRRRATGELDPTYGVDGQARVRLPGAEVNRSVMTVAEVAGELVVAFVDAIVRIDGVGHLRTDLGDGGVVRLHLGRTTDILTLGSDVVVVAEAKDEQGTGTTRCVAAHRFTEALVPAAGWGEGGRSVVCPRQARNDLRGATVSAGAVRILTSSDQFADRDDTVTITGLGPTGRLDPTFGSGGRVDLRNGIDGPTRPQSIVLLPDGGSAVAVDAPDGLGVARLDGTGALVPGFGTGGFATNLMAGTARGSIVARVGGGFLVGGTRGIAAFTSSGAVDTAFGASGVAVLEAGVIDLLELPSGQIVAISGRFNPDHLAVFEADGSGAGTIPLGFTPLALTARGSGVVVAGVQERLEVRALTGALEPDATFAGGGTVVTDTVPAQDTGLTIATGPLGQIYVGSTRFGTLPQITAITAAGSIDPTFASPDFAAVNPSGAQVITAMDVDGLGRLVVAGTKRVHLERLLPTGAHDPTFGDAGVLELDTQDGAAQGVVDLVLDGQDRAVGVATGNGRFVAFRTDTRQSADLPSVSLEDLEVVERGPGARAGGDLTLRLDQPSTVPVVVEVQAVGGTATHPDDIGVPQEFPIRVEIPARSTTFVLPIGVVPDGEVEPDETVTFEITAAYQAEIGDGTATVTIRDDDALRSLTAGNGFVRVGLGPPAGEPPDPNAPPVAGYYLAASQDGAFVTGYVTKGDMTSASLAGLRNGTPADVTVTPFTADGRFLPDRSGTATPRVGGPAGNQQLVGAPASLEVIQGDGHLTATWTPPADDGGSPVWAYLVVAQDAGGGGAFGYTLVEGRSYSLDGLVNGRRYTVSVAPINALGFGGYATTTATPRASGRSVTDPGQPTWVVATTSADRRSATVAIGAPADDGGSPIETYTVIAVQHAQPVAYLTAAPGYPQVHMTGLDPGKPTTYVVVTRNRRGLGNLSIWPPA